MNLSIAIKTSNKLNCANNELSNKNNTQNDITAFNTYCRNVLLRHIRKT